jgi:hypothetical protein
MLGSKYVDDASLQVHIAIHTHVKRSTRHKLARFSAAIRLSWLVRLNPYSLISLVGLTPDIWPRDANTNLGFHEPE